MAANNKKTKHICVLLFNLGVKNLNTMVLVINAVTESQARRNQGSNAVRQSTV